MKKEYYSRLLPDPFIKENGTRLKRPEEWKEQKLHFRALAQKYLYGTWPQKEESLDIQGGKSEPADGGRAVRETVLLAINGAFPFRIEIVRPSVPGKIPVIVWNTTKENLRCPVEEDVLAAGYAVASFDREQIRPDLESADRRGNRGKAEKQKYPNLPCGDIMAWGWGHSVAADYLRTRNFAGPLIAAGHSRGGKAALCAGIFDSRFLVTAPIGSGCGGLGCARFLGTADGSRQDERKCETIGSITHAFPTWFCQKYAEFGTEEKPYPLGDAVNFFPLDANILRAACAPNAVFSSEGIEDDWSNPFGNQLCWQSAEEVFDFLGIPERNGFHIRPGKHEFNGHDWLALIDFCDIVLKRRRTLPHGDLNQPYFPIDLRSYCPQKPEF